MIILSVILIVLGLWLPSPSPWPSSGGRKLQRYRCNLPKGLSFFYYFLLNLLGWCWLVKLYRFQVYNSVTHHLYIALCSPPRVNSPSISMCLTPFTLLYHPLTLFNCMKHAACLLVSGSKVFAGLASLLVLLASSCSDVFLLGFVISNSYPWSFTWPPR